MNKMSIFLVVALLAAGTVAAEDLKFSIGGGIGLEAQNNTATTDGTVLFVPNKSVTTLDSALLNFGVYVDATYAVFGVNYAGQLNKTKKVQKVTAPVETTINDDIDNSAGNIELYIAGKIPIRLVEGLAIFPLLGLEYDINLSYTGKDNLSSDAKAALNDFYVIGGIGADIYLNKSVYFRALVKAGYNLTATPSTTYADTKYTGYKVDAGVSIGFGL